jgi:capsular polysaccharide biosynthesis protein
VTQVWSRVRRGLLRGHAASPGPRRIFVTRHTGKRLCRNVEAVDQVFVDHGFEVVFPERLSLADQAALFDGADVVAGFGGTGLFNLIYASGAPTVIVLNHDAYDVRNEHIIASALGSDIHYFWSAADIRPTSGAFSVEAFKSPWSFDFEANGEALLGLLQDLGRDD